ncbi:hypothetical protein [Massilia sp. X63]|uniref:hypothetical protein n=1 Tax=Massilia sp. X63 TaxID=3237285 RepID=UPI0034DCD4D8
MRLWNLIRTASPTANILAFASLLLLVVKIFGLNRIPSTIDGIYEIGVIFEAILASVIASYVFYLIVVHIQEQSDRDALQPYVEMRTQRIVGDCVAQLREISAAAQVPLDLNTLSLSDVEAAFSRLAPQAPSPIVHLLHQASGGVLQQPVPWMSYLAHYIERSSTSIQKLFAQLRFLDADHVRLLTQIDDCPHFVSTAQVAAHIGRTQTLSFHSGVFYQYCKLCRDLNRYLSDAGMRPVSP